ncbi:MAG TPA: ABC transporter substrate-binding protein [Chloroflexota bacterium]|nr:ABC transporter substrate-binding protein [Chloroflexota bacterium]
MASHGPSRLTYTLRAGRAALLGLGLAVALAGCGPAAPAPSGSAPARQPAAPSGATASAPAASAPPTAGPPIHLVANYAARGTGHSGMWLAYEGGYFREQGLDVELTNITSTSPSLQAMIAGQVQIAGLDPSSSIQATVNGADVALLFAGSNRPLHSMIVNPRITDPQVLRGKIMGITRLAGATYTAAVLALDQVGLQPDRDVALRQFGENSAILAALTSDQIDAGMLSLPHTVMAQRAGYQEMVNLGAAGIEYPTVVVGALRPWVAANEEAVRRFARAFVQGIHRFRTDKPWALDVYRQYLQIDDPDILEQAYAEYLRCCPPVPYVSEEGVARLLADLAADDPRFAGRQPTDFIESRYLREVEASGFLQTIGMTP